MVIKIHFILALLCLVFVSSHSRASEIEENRSLSVDEVIVYALKSNPEIHSFSKNITLADEDIDLARSDYRPNISATGAVTHLNTNNNLTDKWQSDTEKSLSLALNQPLFRGGQTVANISEQENLKKSVENDFSAVVQDKIVEVVSVYMATYTANRAKRVNADNVELLSQQLEATSARFEAGELTKTDVAQAEARLAQAEAEMASAESVFEAALSSFREVTGITDDIDMVYPAFDKDKVPSTLDSALSMGVRLNPDMNAAMARIEAMGYDVDEQRGAFYPQVSLGAEVNTVRDPVLSQLENQETANVSLTASLPLYQSGVLRNQLRQSKIKKSQAKDDLEAVRRSVTNDIVAAWEEYKAVAVQIQARNAQLEASELAYEGVNLEEQVGARSVLDVLDANQDVRDAELSLIETQEDLVNAYYQLLRAIGLLDDSLWDKS